MAIIEKDGFCFYDGLNCGCIAIESKRIESYVRYIRENDIKWISLNNLFYSDENIEFLVDCSFIEKLSITSSSILDYSGLKHLNNLQSLSIEEPKGEVDLSTITSLEELSTEFSKNVIGLDMLNKLKTLKLWKYNPKSKSLKELSSITSLEELQISQSNIRSLEGCENFANLKKFELNYLAKLEYIDEIEKNADTLISLRFDYCKKIKNHDYVSCLRKLNLLAFDNCGEIPSIGFIRQMPNLENFIFVNTNITDGDLSPCIGLKYVGFLNKKHYSHTREDLKIDNEYSSTTKE